MSVVTLLILGVIVGMFVAFIATLGGVTLWMAIADRRERAAAPQPAAQAKAEPEMRRAA